MWSSLVKFKMGCIEYSHDINEAKWLSKVGVTHIFTVKQKYLVDICFQPFVVQQMGKLWRSWKSGLSIGIRKILASRSTKAERTSLIAKPRPHDVSLAELNHFVQGRLSNQWQTNQIKPRQTFEQATIMD